LIGVTVPTVNVRATALRFFFKGHAQAQRSCRRGRIGPRAGPPPRCSQPGRGRSTSRTDDEHQEGGPEPDLRHRPASIGGHITEAHRYRS
jgi:hypothetical protein